MTCDLCLAMRRSFSVVELGSYILFTCDVPGEAQPSSVCVLFCILRYTLLM